MPTEQSNFRLNAEAKTEAYKVLEKIGIKPTDAVNMFMHHIAMFGELPFRPSIPNDNTLKTFKDTDAGKNLNRYDSIDDFFAKMDDD